MRRRIETVRQRSVARRRFRPHVVTRNEHRPELLQRRQNAVELRFARGHHFQARERSLILLPPHPNFFQIKRTAQIHHRVKHFRQRPRVDDVPLERHFFTDFLHLLLSPWATNLGLRPRPPPLRETSTFLTSVIPTEVEGSLLAFVSGVAST